MALDQTVLAGVATGATAWRSRSQRRNWSESVNESTSLIAKRDVPQSGRLDLLEWKALAPWRQHGSEHLQTGYRPKSESLLGCLHSWTYVHNETVNIYSHIIGAILFLSLPFYIFSTEVPPRYKIATPVDVVVCSIYFIGVGICFALSTIFHTFMSHSEAAYTLGIKLDYQGILLLMWGSTIPLAYYSFPCRTGLQVAYWMVDTVLAGLCSLATFHPAIGGPHLGHVRAVLFGSFGLGSFLVPIAHGIVLYGLTEQSQRVGLPWIVLTVFCNVSGGIPYALKVPEKWYPRTFDIVGASHQIMHTMVVFAALAYTWAVLAAFDYRHEKGDTC